MIVRRQPGLLETESDQPLTAGGVILPREPRKREAPSRTFAEVAGTESDLHAVVAVMNGIGDAFLAIPVIRYVISLLGVGRVTVWGSGKYRNTVFREFAYCLHDADSVSGLRSLSREIPAGRRLCWISLNSYALATQEESALRLFSPEFFWGYRRGVRALAPGGPQLRRSDQYFRVVGENQLPGHIDRRPFIPDAAIGAAADYIERASPPPRPIVAVHTETPAVDKEWPLSNWLELADRLADRVNLVLLGQQDQPLRRHRSFLGPASTWDIQLAILSRAAVFVGIDSCWAHVADSMNCPGAVLFARVPFSQWLPRNPSLVPLHAGNGNLHAVAPITVENAVANAIRLSPSSR